MEEKLRDLLQEMEELGKRNDSDVKERPRRMLNITQDTGAFLCALIHAAAARRILEIGTSNGYSTLWLAQAAQATSGTVTTVEISDYKIQMARKNFDRSGYGQLIAIVHEKAQQVLLRTPDAAYDFVFLDAERPEYPQLWSDLKRVLRRGGALVADNATSHPDEMAPFLECVKSDADFVSSLIPIGNGEFLAVKTL